MCTMNICVPFGMHFKNNTCVVSCTRERNKKFVKLTKSRLHQSVKKECSEWWVYGKKTFQSRTNLIQKQKTKILFKEINTHHTQIFFYYAQENKLLHTRTRTPGTRICVYTSFFLSPFFYTHMAVVHFLCKST